MSKSEEMQRLERDLGSSETLRRKWEETIKEIADKKIAKNDGEVLEMAANKLGYNIKKEELEVKKASSEELDQDELINITGGEKIYVEYDPSEHSWCAVHYACYGAFLHPDQGTNGPCWSDYNCIKVDKNHVL